jgi:hypothetical protein
VRAFNDKYIDIMFRIHAEFQLGNPPFYPLWFTPSHFAGHVTISRDLEHVAAFRLFVPTDKPLNVDLEWMVGPKGVASMEVDIGFLPRMELFLDSTSINHKETEYGEDYLENDQAFVWTEEISVEKARLLLEKEMYPFKAVTYYNFTEGFHQAVTQNKPLHSIMLWGGLDDQSC